MWVCMYRYICICLRSVFFFSLSRSLFSFLFCVPYSCLPTFSLEVDVQTLKPPGAKPRTGKYIRVGYNFINNNNKKKTVSNDMSRLHMGSHHMVTKVIVYYNHLLSDHVHWSVT